jgi:LmbE family N-acetylglucosaminyl deacetylase
MKRILLSMAISLAGLAGFSQVPKTYTSSEILQKIKKLNVLGTVLYVAAHPDDENTRLIAWLANEKLYQTGYLSMTRGDGGQNLIGDEQGIELGLIRTQELLAARRIDGGQQFFTRAYDFGFSKSTEEALKTWDKEKTLSDVVWVIRKFQPDVIVTRFPPDNRAGHGHHSASAVLAAEAFDAAADPNRFPEQFQYGVKPWQARRILWNTFNFGGSNNIDTTQFKLDAGGYSPLLGMSYGELAAESRSQHKSQGFGVPRSRGSQMEFFTLTKGDKPVNDLTDGVDMSWNRVQGGEKISKLVGQIVAAYQVASPESSVPALINLLKTIRQLPESHWKTIKERETEQLIQLCAGIYAEAVTTKASVCQGDSLTVAIEMISRSSVPVVIKTAGIASPEHVKEASPLIAGQPLVANKTFSKQVGIYIDPEKVPITQPYWLEKQKEPGYYTVDDQTKIGQPNASPALVMQAVLLVSGTEISLQQPIQYDFNDPVKGEQYQPFTVVPKLEMRFEQDNYLGLNEKPVTVVSSIVSNCVDTASYTIFKKIPDSWATQFGSIKYAPKGRGNLYDSSVYQPKPNSLNSSALLQLDNPYVFPGYKRNISYDHIPTITYFKPASTHLMNLDIKLGGKNIGYISGAGDKVAEDLSQLGYSVTILDENDLAANNLQRFDAIITGVRAYNVHSWLSDKYDVLMDYVNKGGNLIVQYNTNSFVGPIKSKIAPYPLNISRNRITDETAAVNFLLPNHPALNFPNKISSKDFEGWIQERSIYHADQLDSKYESILSMSDPGEQPHSGALVVAPYGKGNFVYTGLVFFRELPAGVPGAYRLMANLLALPKH